MKKAISTGILISLILVPIFLSSVVKNFSKPLANEPDTLYNYFIQENNLTKMSSLNLNGLFETRMFYPHQKTLAFGNSQLGISPLGLPVYLITKNTIMAANSIILITFFLSFMSMYLLAYFLTKNIAGSLIAGLIYTYNPFVFSHTPYHFELFTLQWIPLIFLSAEKLLAKPSFKWAILFALFFFWQLTSSFYYTFFVAICLPIYMLLKIHFGKIHIRGFAKPSIFLSLFLLVVSSYLFLQPFLFVKEQFQLERSLDNIILLSAKPLDFLFTTPKNIVYGQMHGSSFFSSLRDPYYQEHYTEHSLHPGFSVYFLLLISVSLLLRKKLQHQTKMVLLPFLILLAIVFVLSLGPYIKISNFQVPLPYLLLYKFVPLADAIRAPARFMVIGFMALGIITAFSTSYLIENAKKTKKVLLTTLISIFLIIEYLNVGNKPYDVDEQLVDFYKSLENNQEVKVIVELPMANNLYDKKLFRSLSEDSEYLLYALYHDKKMVNGYNSFVPPSYPTLGNQLTVNFPTGRKIKISLLKNMGADTIIVHPQNYKDKQKSQEIIDRLKKMGFKEILISPKAIAISLNSD